MYKFSKDFFKRIVIKKNKKNKINKINKIFYESRINQTTNVKYNNSKYKLTRR